MKKYVVVMIVLSACLGLLIGANIYQKIVIENNKKIIKDTVKELASYSNDISKEKDILIKVENELRETVLKNKTQIEGYNLWEEKNEELEKILK